MKQRDELDRSQDTSTTKRIPWDADNATENGPTSLEVLLMWIITPGHCERLHSKQRNRAIISILSALERHGIHHRTESGIRSKVRSIESQYVDAKLWLEERDLSGDDIIDGTANADAQAGVLALCPRYCDLFPVLRHSSYLDAMAASKANAAEGDQAATDSDDKAKSVCAKQKRRPKKKDASRPSKQRRVSSTEMNINEVDEKYPRKPHVVNCVRRSTTFGAMHDGDMDFNAVDRWLRTDQCELVVRNPDAQLPCDFQRQVAEIKLDHAKKESKAVLESDDKMRTAMMECDLEVKRRRGQVQLLLERVLARQTMKKEGVPKEEIDTVIPLKES
ncbi:uncharacterized protein IUM83_09621 [Phytophthora cinnamomi]|uniref:uncharacterized protein n=1 Tax=Phytophthora cinnamomi TaxID=4785 RepID=UPI002A27962C|nr:hypothetical protein IUM83_09621 [Phytophthora cinnamomi]KAJ8569371.1 hypothetical protein ON010_g5887 [Phytophthora cinnamomi]